MIDKGENIIDYYGRTVFRNDLLNVARGQDASIPLVFRINVLTKPQNDQEETHLDRSEIDKKSSIGAKSALEKMMGKTTASIFNNNETDSNFSKLPP